jgi:hypothetical protein
MRPGSMSRGGDGPKASGNSTAGRRIHPVTAAAGDDDGSYSAGGVDGGGGARVAGPGALSGWARGVRTPPSLP